MLGGVSLANAAAPTLGRHGGLPLRGRTRCAYGGRTTPCAPTLLCPLPPAYCASGGFQRNSRASTSFISSFSVTVITIRITRPANTPGVSKFAERSSM